jgi:hypothetical protein
MLQPAIKYFIASKEFKSPNEEEETYRLLLAKELDDGELDVIIIVPTKDDDPSVLDGSNITFQQNLMSYKGEEYCFEELAIMMDEDDSKCYLVLENSKQKLWYLPNSVADFLEMNKTRNIKYALAIFDEKPTMLKIAETNTVPSKAIPMWSKELVLRKEGGLSKSNKNKNEINEYPVSFVFHHSKDQAEVMEQSYFQTYNSKYYLNDCMVMLDDEKNCKMVGVYSKKLKIDDEKIINGTTLLAYVNI